MSTDGQVDLRVNADFNRLENAMARQQNKVVRLENANARLLDKIKKVENQTARGSNNSVAALGRVAGAYISISKAVGIATEAVQENIDITRRASFRDTTQAQADAELASVTFGFESSERDRLFKAVKEQRPVGFTQAEFTQTVAEALTVTSGNERERIDQALKSAVSSAAIHVTKKDEAGAFAGAVVNINRSLGGVASFDEMLALMGGVRSQSSLKTTESLKEVVPVAAVADVTSPKTTDRLENIITSLAIFSAFSGRAGDSDGSIAKTGTTNFIADLERVLPEKLDVTERLAAVVGDKNLQKEIISSLKGRAATKPIGREIAEGGLTFDMIEEIRTNLRRIIRERGFEEVRDFMSRGTAALSRSVATEESTAVTDMSVRQESGFRGAVERQLFSDESGAISNMPGIGNYFQRKIAKLDFYTKLLSTNNDDVGAIGTAGIVALNAFRGQNANRDQAIDEHISNIETMMANERKLNEVQFEAEKRGQVRGAAAAHIQAHSE